MAEKKTVHKDHKQQNWDVLERRFTVELDLSHSKLTVTHSKPSLSLSLSLKTRLRIVIRHMLSVVAVEDQGALSRDLEISLLEISTFYFKSKYHFFCCFFFLFDY